MGNNARSNHAPEEFQHEISLELIRRSHDLDDLMDLVLDEYERRLTELQDETLECGFGAEDGLKSDARLKALMMFAGQAAELMVKAENNRDLQNALGEAEAFLARIETELKQLPFQIRRAESDCEAANRVYQGKLSVKDVVAGVEVDIAKSKADAAKALLDGLRGRSESLGSEQAALSQRRDALQTQLELLVDEIRARDQAEAKVKAATARIAQAGVVVAEIFAYRKRVVFGGLRINNRAIAIERTVLTTGLILAVARRYRRFGGRTGRACRRAGNVKDCR